MKLTILLALTLIASAQAFADSIECRTAEVIPEYTLIIGAEKTIAAPFTNEGTLLTSRKVQIFKGFEVLNPLAQLYATGTVTEKKIDLSVFDGDNKKIGSISANLMQDLEVRGLYGNVNLESIPKELSVVCTQIDTNLSPDLK